MDRCVQSAICVFDFPRFLHSSNSSVVNIALSNRWGLRISLDVLVGFRRRGKHIHVLDGRLSWQGVGRAEAIQKLSGDWNDLASRISDLLYACAIRVHVFGVPFPSEFVDAVHFNIISLSRKSVHTGVANDVLP